MNKYFYHGVNGLSVIRRFWDIINDGEIKCRRKLGCGTSYSFHGFVYVCVCTKEADELYKKYEENAFYDYIVNHITFVIRKVDAIKPKLISECDEEIDLRHLVFKNNNERYTTLFDEWQVQNSIDLSDVVAIAIPLSNVQDGMFGLEKEEYQDFIIDVKTVAETLKMDLLDSSNPKFADNYENKVNFKYELCYNMV